MPPGDAGLSDAWGGAESERSGRKGAGLRAVSLRYTAIKSPVSNSFYWHGKALLRWQKRCPLPFRLRDSACL